MKAIIYIRYSTLDQAKGHSTERQRGDCRGMAERHGWELTGEEIIDEGKSAYSGANVSDSGALGKFVARVTAGHYVPGHVLVVERLDRLSRQEPEEVFALLKSLTSAGMSVATVDGDEKYRAGEKLDMVKIITSAVKIGTSNQESAKKSQRVAAAMAAKRAKLGTGHIMTNSVPGWLRVDRVAGKIDVIPERVEVVRRMYEMADSGMGRGAIVRKLNEDRVPTWGKSPGWYISIVKNILTNPAVVGDFQPHSKAQGVARHPVGDVIRGYFPVIIGADQFARVNNAKTLNQRKSTAIRGNNLSNIFAGLGKCHQCDGRMAIMNKINRGKTMTRTKPDGTTRSYVRSVGESYLVCDNARRALCSVKTRYRYEYIVRGVLDAVLHLSMDDVHFAAPSDVTRLVTEIAELDRARIDAAARADRLLEMFARVQDETIEAKWAATRAEAVAIAAKIVELEKQLADARGAVSPEDHILRVAAIRAMIDDDDADKRFAARSRVVEALRATVESMRFSIGPDNDRINLTMIGGVRILSFSQKGELGYSIPLPVSDGAVPLMAAEQVRAREAEVVPTGAAENYWYATGAEGEVMLVPAI